MIFQFKQQYGMNLHDAKLPAQSYFESFEERLHNGVIEAETLAHVVSLEQERVKIASKPELSTQMRMHLDSTLTLQTKKRYNSRMPTDPESLRTKYRVMTSGSLHSSVNLVVSFTRILRKTHSMIFLRNHCRPTLFP